MPDASLRKFTVFNSLDNSTTFRYSPGDKGSSDTTRMSPIPLGEESPMIKTVLACIFLCKTLGHRLVGPPLDRYYHRCAKIPAGVVFSAKALLTDGVAGGYLLAGLSRDSSKCREMSNTRERDADSSACRFTTA